MLTVRSHSTIAVSHIRYIGRLMVKMRAIQGREDVVVEVNGSNPTDGDMIDVLQDSPDDLTREELRQELRAVRPLAQAGACCFDVGRPWGVRNGAALSKKHC